MQTFLFNAVTNKARCRPVGYHGSRTSAYSRASLPEDGNAPGTATSTKRIDSLDQSRSSSERDYQGHRFETEFGPDHAVPGTTTLENIQKLLAEPWPGEGEDLGATRNA